MSMTSEERLVSLGAKELLTGISPSIGVISLEDDVTNITLPATIISARFKSEPEGAGLGSQYDLTVEHRYLRKESTFATEDDIFRRIGNALCPSGETDSTGTSTITGSFSYYRIENQNNSTDESGETAIRSRTYTLFAKLS